MGSMKSIVFTFIFAISCMLVIIFASLMSNFRLVVEANVSSRILESVCNRILSIIYRTSLIALKCNGFRKATVNVSIPIFAGDSIFNLRLVKFKDGIVYLEVSSKNNVFFFPLPRFIVDGEGEVSSSTGCLTLTFKKVYEGIIIHIGGS